MFTPVHHLIIVLLRWSYRFVLIFMFKFVHVSVILFFEFKVFFFLTLLFNFCVLFFFLFFLFYDFVASYINRIVADLWDDHARVGVNKRFAFYRADLFLFKLLFFTFDLSFLFSLKLLDSVVKTVGFFHLRNRFFCRYFL